MSRIQAEADQDLLNYDSYEDYLDSLWTDLDLCNLRSVEVCRTIAEQGYRAPGETLKKEEYATRRAAAQAYFHPTYKPYEMASLGMERADEIHSQLAIRERANRVGIMSTIIFVRVNNEKGHPISGYIDYSESLHREDWKSFFHGNKIIMPKPSDLSYYNWKTQKCVSNDSVNYMIKVREGCPELILQYRFDRLTINLRPNANPGKNTYRKRVHGEPYDIVILIDHVVRKRI